MARHAILGNGSLTIGLSDHGLVHDFYYPYVGQDNLTNSRSTSHKIGIWVDGEFSWVYDGSWDISVDFRDDALISHVSMTNHQLGVHIQTEDFVHPYADAFCRRIGVTSLREGTRDIRIFMHQVFEISRNGRADTALYEPDGHYIFDYKGDVCLVISGKQSSGEGFDQYAVGNYGIEGKEGTFKDAEDGELSGSPVEHGGVDSVIRFQKNLDENQTFYFDYWIAAGETHKEAEAIHNTFVADGIQSQRDTTLAHWQKWLQKSDAALSKTPSHQKIAARKSLLIIKAHIDKRGGVVASCDSSIYNYGRDYYSYVWPRDGAFALWPLIRLDYQDEPKKFFEFCKSILTDEGYLMHKYQPDGTVGSTWHPEIRNHHRELAIQEDETAIVVFMLHEFYKQSGDKEFLTSLYKDFVVPATNFLSTFMDDSTGLPHASYDLWEEKFLTSTYSVSVVYGALISAQEIARVLGHSDDADRWDVAVKKIENGFSALYNQEGFFRKGILQQHDGSLGIDDTLDISSLFGPVMFASSITTASNVEAMTKIIEEKLLDSSPSGGLPRYQHDQYFASSPPYSGNPWFVTTLWYAQIQKQLQNLDKANELLDWSMSKMLPSGVLSEQIDPTTSEAKSVTPLVWSHAELINTILDVTST